MKNILPKLIAFLLVVSACKKDPAPSQGAQRDMPKELTQAINMLDNAASDFIFLLDSLNGDTLNAFFGAAQAMYLDRDIVKVETQGSYMVWATYKSGLKVAFSWELDSNGKAVTRGGGKPSSDRPLLTQSFLKTSSEKFIDNKKVLFYSPAKDLTTNDNSMKSRIEGFKGDFEVTIREHELADLGALISIKDYGLIILNTHGNNGMFRIGTNVTEFNIPHEANRDDIKLEAFLSYLATEKYEAEILKGLKDGTMHLSLSASLDTITQLVNVKSGINVNYKYIRNMAPLDEDAVVFLNFCHSGWSQDGALENNLPEAFKAIGAKAVYAYAYPNGSSNVVDDAFANSMVDSLVENLMHNEDSTGIAHLAYDAVIQEHTGWSRRNPDYQHVFPNYFDATIVVIDRKNKKKYLQVLDYTYDIPKVVPAELSFYHYFDPGYMYTSCGTFRDQRDNQLYKKACIGNQVWMAENLNWDGAGVCYDNLLSHCETYGRLYSYQEVAGNQYSSPTTTVQGICPNDWHLPSEAEINELITFCGGAAAALDKLKSKTAWPTPNQNTDAFGFALKPSGLYLDHPGNGPSFLYKEFSGYFWSSSAKVSPTSTGPVFVATATQLQVGGFIEQDNYKFPCRCIQD